MAKKPLPTRVIEVGKDMEIDGGFEGTLTKKCMKRIQGMRFAQDLAEISQSKDDPLTGLEMMMAKLGEVYTDIKLKYGDHKFECIEDLWETDKGEELIKQVLIPGIAAPMPLSKN